MLTSPNDQPRCLSFAEAQPGDEFYLVGSSRITSSPVSVTLYKVIRAGKRDIVCTTFGSSVEKKITRTATLDNAYLTKEEVTWAKDAIRLRNKQMAAWKAIQAHKIEAITEDLADRIVAWGQALQTEKSKPHE